MKLWLRRFWWFIAPVAFTPILLLPVPFLRLIERRESDRAWAWFVIVGVTLCIDAVTPFIAVITAEVVSDLQARWQQAKREVRR